MLIRLIAIAFLLIASSAGAQDITAIAEPMPMSSETVVRFGTGDAVDSFTEAIPSCSGMWIIFEQANSAVVALYAVNPDDDTLAEIEGATLLSTFSASTGTAVSVSPGTMGVRFVVDAAESSGTSVASIRCANVVGSSSTPRNTAATMPPASGSSNWGIMKWGIDNWG